MSLMAEAGVMVSAGLSSLIVTPRSMGGAGTRPRGIAAHTRIMMARMLNLIKDRVDQRRRIQDEGPPDRVARVWVGRHHASRGGDRSYKSAKHGCSPRSHRSRLSQPASDNTADTATTGTSVAPGEDKGGVAFCRRSLEIRPPAQAVAPGTDGRLFPADRGLVRGATVAWLYRLQRRHAAPGRE